MQKGAYHGTYRLKDFYLTQQHFNNEGSVNRLEDENAQEDDEYDFRDESDDEYYHNMY